MLITLVIEEFFLLLLFLLRVANILFYFFTVRSFIIQYFLSLLFFLSLMQQSYLCLFIQFHLLPKLLLVLVFHVTSALIDDVACLLSGLLDFLESTVLLLFQETNTIGQES